MKLRNLILVTILLSSCNRYVVQDGTYTAQSESFSRNGPMTCQVTFGKGKITDIRVIEEYDSRTSDIASMAFDIFIPRIINQTEPSGVPVGKPIPNLFAAGNDCPGVMNNGNKPYTLWGGQAHSWAMTSGYIAGTNAAKVSE